MQAFKLLLRSRGTGSSSYSFSLVRRPPTYQQHTSLSWTSSMHDRDCGGLTIQGLCPASPSLCPSPKPANSLSVSLCLCANNYQTGCCATCMKRTSTMTVARRHQVMTIDKLIRGAERLEYLGCTYSSTPYWALVTSGNCGVLPLVCCEIRVCVGGIRAAVGVWAMVGRNTQRIIIIRYDTA